MRTVGSVLAHCAAFLLLVWISLICLLGVAGAHSGHHAPTNHAHHEGVIVALSGAVGLVWGIRLYLGWRSKRD